MTRTLTAILLFSLAALSFAGLAVGRSFENVKLVSSALVTDAGSGTGAATYTYAYKTVETITVKNTGKYVEGNVLIMRDYSGLPESFSPNATVVSNKTAVWKFGRIAPGETAVASAIFASVLEPSEIASAPVPYFQLEEPRAKLEVEDGGLLGSRIDIRLVREDGTPVAGEDIIVFLPSGKRMALVTDEAGFASFRPSESGAYYYSVEGYQILNSASTLVKGSAGSPVSASIRADEVSPDSLVPLIPVIGGFAVAAVLLLGGIFFFASRKENGDRQMLEIGGQPAARKAMIPMPELPTHEVVYDDKERAKLDKAREMTQKIIEMRKQELANQAAQERDAIRITEEDAASSLRQQYSRRPRRPDEKRAELKQPEQKKPELLRKAGARPRTAGKARKSKEE